MKLRTATIITITICLSISAWALINIFVIGIAAWFSEAKAEPLQGYDILGLAKQDVGMIAKTIEPGTAVGTLLGTFGDPLPALDKLLQTGKVKAFRVHLINGTCWRNNNCEKGEPRPNDFRAMEARATAVRNLNDRYPNVACYISPVLEHDERHPDNVKRWFDIIQEAAPNCKQVVSAFTGVRPKKVLQEGHGATPSGDVISTDGNSFYDINTVRYGSGREALRLGWIHRFNLRTTGEKVFVPPSKRTAKATQDNIRQVSALLHPEEPKLIGKPPQCKKVRELKDKELWKTNSEDYNNGDKRGNKPLLISKYKNNRMDILDVRGNRVGCLQYYGPFSDGGGYYRHYAGSCSGDSAISLKGKAGSEWVFVNTGKECLMVNAIRRKGYFRDSGR